MSYYQKISQDAPLGFWTLENGYINKDMSSGNLQTGQRVKNNLILSDSSANFYQDTFPLVMGGTNAYKFSSSNSFKINNIYNVFYRNTEKKVFTMEFWISFDDIPQSEQIITIKNDSNVVGYLIFKDNFASWTMWDSNNNAYTAKALVDSYEPQLYIVMSYLDRSMNITINGVNSGVARIPEGSQFMPLVSDPPYFQFGPRNNTTYAIDNVAFYNYTLTKLQMEQRYAWAKNEKNSDTFTIKNNGGIIDFHDKMGVVNDYILFNTNSSWNSGSSRNAVVENNSLETKFILSAKAYNNLSNASISYSTVGSKTGLVTTSSNSVMVENFEDLYNISSDAITSQIYFNASNTTRSCYYSISGFNFGTLVLESTADSKIRLYSFENPSVIDLSYTPPTSGWYDVKVYTVTDKIYFQVNQQNALVAQYSTAIGCGNLNAYLGNCYADQSTNYPNSNPIANFSVFGKTEVSSNPLLNIENSAIVKFSLNGTLSAAQHTTWNTLITLDNSFDIIGSRVYYDTASKNISVEFSYDNETWYALEESGDQIPNFTLYTTGDSIYVRVVMDSPDSENVRLFINYLEIATFRKLSIDSQGFPFTLSPVQNSNNTMIIKNNKNNILARDANVGIYFQPESSVGHKAGSSLITCYEDYSTIEFIFRLEDSIGGAYCYLLDSSDSQNYIRYNPSNMQLSWAGFNKIYLNGFAIAPGKVIQVGELYHLAAVKNSAILETVTLTLNSKYDDTLHAHSTYGKLCIYSDAKSDQFIRGKYLRMIGMNKYCISDSFSGSIVDSSSVYDEPDAIIAV